MSALDEMVSIWMPSTDLLRPANFPFTFHEVQEDYFIADSPVLLSMAANRIGKTTAAHCDNIWRAHGVHPYKKVPLISTLWSGFPDFPFYNKVTRKIFLELVTRRLLVHWS